MAAAQRAGIQSWALSPIRVVNHSGVFDPSRWVERSDTHRYQSVHAAVGDRFDPPNLQAHLTECPMPPGAALRLRPEHAFVWRT